MKAAKALKKLEKIEALMSVVIDRYAANDHRVQEALQDAKGSVIRAKEVVKASPAASKKPAPKRVAVKQAAAKKVVSKKVAKKTAAKAATSQGQAASAA